MSGPSEVSAIAHQIQLAVAPVFLLAGIGSILNVLTHRLGRVVDRARQLEATFASFDEGERSRFASELHTLDGRITASNLAIFFCTASAFFVCLVVGLIFVASLAEAATARIVTWLFIAAMALLMAGLVLFLYEVRLATRSIRVRRDLLPNRAAVGPPRRGRFWRARD